MKLPVSSYINEGIPVSYKDVESIDPDFAKSLQVQFMHKHQFTFQI